jgi:predicted CXXCH cytochrome family protein
MIVSYIQTAAVKLPTALLLFCLLVAINPSDAIAAPAAASNRECALCHVMWLADFKRTDIVSLIPYDPKPVTSMGTVDIVSDRFMCISCHDGFVMDSRSLWRNGAHSHSVGQKPADGTVLPTLNGKEQFPLSEEGNIYCGTCHSAHGTSWKDPGAARFLRADNTNSALCLTCHQQLSRGVDAGNHPVNTALDELPQVLLDQGAKFSSERQVICESCHGIHATADASLLVINNSNSELCSFCHSQQKDIITNKHNLAITSPDTMNVNDDKPISKGPCSACHLPHNAEGPRLWARNMDDNLDGRSGFCTTCHDDDAITSKNVGDHNGHPLYVSLDNLKIQSGFESTLDFPETGLENSRLAQSLPLYDDQGKQVKTDGAIACATCHDPHQWQQPYTVTAAIPLRSDSEIKFDEGDNSNSFLRIANQGASALCTNCHRREALVIDTKHDLNISAPESRNRSGATPLQSGVCGACHLPHNDAKAEAGMLASIRANSHTEAEQRCASCHQEGALASKYQTGEFSHPNAVPLGKMVQRKLLPLLAEDDDMEPLVDCNTCHNPHVWDPGIQTHNIEDISVLEGDGSNSFLRMKASGNAELCINCHEGAAVVIGTDHDLSLAAGDAPNPDLQSAQQPGACGQCHATHNAGQAHRLWPVELTAIAEDGRNITDQMCINCHNSAGLAKAKVPDEMLHPSRNVPVNPSRVRRGKKTWNLNPVYDTEGKASDFGHITCLTCHNPHRWSAAENLRPEDIKSGNREGDALSSFLNTTNTVNFLCADCHGPDSLYRYKFYHWQDSRAQERPRILR